MQLKDKIILITGAGRGLGQALAVMLAAQGAIIAAVDINPIGLEETVAQITAGGGKVKDYLDDVAKRLPIVALVQEVLDDWGQIDLLINAAFVQPRDPILGMDEWDWHRTLDVNLSAPFFLIQAVSKAMKAQGGGTIINLVTPLDPARQSAAVAASLAGLEALTRTAQAELAADQIHVGLARSAADCLAILAAR